MLRFEPAPDWPELPEGVEFGGVSAVAADSTGRIYVGHRGERTILVFEADGSFVRSQGDDDILPRHGKVYGDYLGQFPFMVFNSEPPPAKVLYEATLPFLHGLYVDRWDNLWVTDVGQSIVLAYDREGRLIRRLGVADDPGDTENRFNQPTDVAVNRQGEIFVSDGYLNNRIVKFSPEGEFIAAWGSEGKGPGEFRTPHALAIGGNERVYVSDRWNRRVQVFDFVGRYIEEWTDIGLSSSGGDTLDGIRRGPDGLLYGCTGAGNRIVVLDEAGALVDSWGDALFDYVHWICFDPDGSLYTAEMSGQRARKFRKKSGMDPGAS